jgi:hypothetical protein
MPRRKGSFDPNNHTLLDAQIVLRMYYSDVHDARLESYDEQYVIGRQTSGRPDINRKEIRGGHHLPVRFQERRPREVFSLAIRSTKSVISCTTWGRPSPFLAQVHFFAMSLRCYASSVSGVTSVSSSSSNRRPRTLAFTASRIRCSLVSGIRRSGIGYAIIQVSVRQHATNRIIERCSPGAGDRTPS